MSSSSNRRDELLDQVVDHLVEHGLSGLSLRPLAAALGVSTYSLSYHFGNKEGLLEAAALRIEERIRAVGEHYAQRAPASPCQAVEDIWPLTVDSMALDRLALELSVQREHRLPDGLRRRLTSAWVDWATDAFCRRGMPKEMAEEEATLLNAVLLGLQIDLRNTGDRDRVDRTLRSYARSCERRWGGDR